MTVDYQPRRANGVTVTDEKPPRRAALDQLSPRQQALVDLETVAITLTGIGLTINAERVRDAARRLT